MAFQARPASTVGFQLDSSMGRDSKSLADVRRSCNVPDNGAGVNNTSASIVQPA
ncbi:hypothetical protein DSO57_1007433 [Entomophthora muscae]|uniref:Uncharacterized protein n=1 Tax=Entomophthora muscae TaxID=34485 RepID=A0ACC2T7D2_9FUNG|nr:hypothetical protein DSO57_1007433 [Entomophthora muscae]